MDKELIAMCDCPEIQDKKPYREALRLGCQFAIHEPAMVMHGWHFGTYIGDDRITNLPHTTWISIDMRNAIYIPRIEDVLEWLRPYLNNADSWPALKINIKFCLEAFMHLNHGKSWNGKEWV